ncbi:MAG: 2-oxo acid dehydrogenase subunit E2 [Oscillibacter sp.]|nr:2-oxo acid dehydrogenase subunit E2 [Oscillibacter sp.]
MEETRKRRWGDRKDADWVRDLDGVHAIMPHIMPKRTDAEVYVNMEFDVTEALAYIEKKNEGETEYRATLFHCILMAIAKTVYLRPLLNRYISGRRIYQRHAISLGFVAKKRFEDHSEETLVVTEAPEDWTLTAVTEKVIGKVHTARTEQTGGVNGAMDVLRRLPRWFLMLFVGVIRLLDFYGKVPESLKSDDPDFASVYLTNLGSIRCPSVYHHLNNYGTNSIMVAIGTIEKTEKIAPDGAREVRDVVKIGVTLDERIADGFYFARSLKIVQYLLSNPELLERPLKEEIDFAC